MRRFKDVFNYARNNNIKAINNSIQNIGRKHHAVYMKNMMFANDININYQLLSEIQNTVKSFYQVFSENCLIKKDAQNILGSQCENRVLCKDNLYILTEEQLSTLVYQQAMRYYFKIDIKNESGSISYFDDVIQYRIASNFLQSDMERILTKMYEDIEIIIEDTQNIDFLIRNYKKIDKLNNLYHCISEQLAESIRNVLLQDGKFDKEYFVTVKNISSTLQKNFYGG